MLLSPQSHQVSNASFTANGNPPRSFVIETSHAAALHASYSRRTKIKVDDFKFAIRKDPKKLGRVVELLNKEKLLKSARQGFDFNEGKLRKEAQKDEKDKDKDDRNPKKRKERDPPDVDEGKSTKG